MSSFEAVLDDTGNDVFSTTCLKIMLMIRKLICKRKFFNNLLHILNANKLSEPKAVESVVPIRKTTIIMGAIIRK